MRHLRLPLPKMISFAIATLAGMTQMQVVVPGTPVQPLFSRSGQLNQLNFVPPPLPPDNGTPGGRRRGGASRGNCPRVDKPLTALVPVAKNTSGTERVWGLTTVERPTFWFYVPYKAAFAGKLVLQDEADRDISQTLFRPPGTSGTIGVSPQSTAAPLETGRRYHWYLLISCSSADFSDPVFVEGWVQRVALNPTLKSQLNGANLQKRAALYATNSIWYDALTTLVPLRRANPKNPDWTQLLQAVGLQAIAPEPIVNCCAPLQSKRAKQSYKRLFEKSWRV